MCILGGVLLGGCEVLDDIADGVEAPTAALERVDLVHAPEVDELAAWQCYEAFSDVVCQTGGLSSKPKKNQLKYSFDLVFDLGNPNESIPIPLVELLLGMDVYEGNNLGRACVSFCDPDVEDCAPAIDAEGACQADEAEDVDSFEDIIPTVEDLVDIGEAVMGDDLDNGDWRWVNGGESVEAHIQFDLDADVMLDLGDELINDALDDVLAGRNIKLEVPYAADGSVFFDVPELGRKAIGFGPAENTWVVQ
jgi:hypothetical protein